MIDHAQMHIHAYCIWSIYFHAIQKSVQSIHLIHFLIWGYDGDVDATRVNHAHTHTDSSTNTHADHTHAHTHTVAPSENMHSIAIDAHAFKNTNYANGQCAQMLVGECVILSS